MNKNLQKARVNKNDEFYTQYKDIEREVDHYGDYFSGKVVYMNCDDPLESKFTDYFVDKFDEFGIKKLIATRYMPNGTGWYWEYSGNDWLPFRLRGDGDFRSDECVAVLKGADVVVTNPPFSLFLDFIDLMFQYDKEFLVIGNYNAVTYKKIFPLFQQNKVWTGMHWVKEFGIPKDAPEKVGQRVDKGGNRFQKFGNITWFTNMKVAKPQAELSLTKKFDPSKYSAYDNYKAINVDRVKSIPVDYEGVMGVPITYLWYYDPEQFEMLGCNFQVKSGELEHLKVEGYNGKFDCGYIDGKRKYYRIFIRRRDFS